MKRFDVVKQRLQDLDFTSYEAMAYVSLLECNPVTRYELAKNSGVPRSAIYNVIKKLEQSGAVNPDSAKPEKYIPLPPDHLLEYLERQFNNKLEKARELLKNFDTQIVPDHLWNIIGYDNLILKIKEIIDKTHKIIYISFWRREFKLLIPELKQAIKRGVEVVIFSFTSVALSGAKVFSYDLDEKELEKIWDHKIIVIADKNELVMGVASRGVDKKTVWTKNRALVDIALNHIILDITIFGIRLEKKVSSTIKTMQNGETDYLSKLLLKKFPDIKF